MTALRMADMIAATNLTREGRLQEAMDIIKGITQGVPPSPTATVDATYEVVNPGPGPISTRPGWTLESFKRRQQPQPAAPSPGGRFEQHEFGAAAGSRSYKLYIPGSFQGASWPLVVMMHGCTQSPEDFAAGTCMNAVAEEKGFLVAYPGQPKSANPSRCWNWFSHTDQKRDQGEASLIAGITRDVVREFGLDPRRVYIAGLSAGGAAAANMGSAYPDLYAAVGVHSGLACGAARDLPSALQAMRQGSSPTSRSAPGIFIPTIVFHGDRDTTVVPVNGDQIVAQAASHLRLSPSASAGTSPGGIPYRRTVWSTEDQRSFIEQWLLHGLGHAWSGGCSEGSYTAPRGPDASREMIRFFLQHSLPHS